LVIEALQVTNATCKASGLYQRLSRQHSQEAAEEDSLLLNTIGRLTTTRQQHLSPSGGGGNDDATKEDTTSSIVIKGPCLIMPAKAIDNKDRRVDWLMYQNIIDWNTRAKEFLITTGRAEHLQHKFCEV
jgi:hypothetical protein